MDYVYILTSMKIPEEWMSSSPYSILKEVCSDAVSKFIADPQALILMEFGGGFSPCFRKMKKKMTVDLSLENYKKHKK